MRLSNRILMATTNREKFEEFKSLFAAYPGIEPVSADAIIRNPAGLQFAERHDTYLENAIAKARLANTACHYPALADDSGLEVEFLGGKPGVRSHRYASPRPGLTQDQANTQFLLSEMKNAGSAERGARFVCTLALLIEGIMLTSTGILEGTIIDQPRGAQGFGYDPVFIPKGSAKSLAEMTAGQKNSISHRAKALHELMAKVKTHGITLAKP
jgi:XTP/dITP diphosphohydrolase